MGKLAKRAHKTVIRTEVKFIICQASVEKKHKNVVCELNR